MFKGFTLSSHRQRDGNDIPKRFCYKAPHSTLPQTPRNITIDIVLELLSVVTEPETFDVAPGTFMSTQGAAEGMDMWLCGSVALWLCGSVAM